MVNERQNIEVRITNCTRGEGSEIRIMEENKNARMENTKESIYKTKKYINEKDLVRREQVNG